MGAHNSHAKKEDFPNLNTVQINALLTNLKKHTTATTFSAAEASTILPYWGEFAKVAFENLARKEGSKKDRLPFALLVQQANLLEGIASEQADGLTNLFGDKWREALAACSRHLLSLSPENALALLSILRTDKSSNLTNLLTANRLAAELVHLPFKELLEFESKPPMATLNGNTVLLSRAAQVVLRAHIPVEFRHTWQLLFSSNEHGSSFAQLTHQVDGQGPCFVVVRTTKNRVFGCYASHGFHVGPTYLGDTLCFLFSITPEIRVFEPTGFNKKYCYLNIQQETLPNGLGVGGSDINWPFFISEQYGKGMATPHSSSFEKCDLAGETEFDIDTLEIWRVGPPPQKKKERSILDKDPQAQALLEIAGKTMHSEGFRDAKPILDDDDDEE
ncbi:hypothetical protein PENTCL1PPCAC_23457 [Pristionchus entomophagus]|uniref:MTOR-associated protein MEAK7 n=1 Tax=Pristionchus entomophagus TaxID=358040 RepID=A0AAV5U4H3_9BILA|nr:hypothetical protein PENTCL1PPCAC_23457 [Pristionchus entomophagus]